MSGLLIKDILEFSWERDGHYLNLAYRIYLEQGIIVLIGCFHKPSLPRLVAIWVKSKATIKSIWPSCLHSYPFSIGDNA
jgi:hypothetical protein